MGDPVVFVGNSFAFFGGFSYWPSYHGVSPTKVAQQRGAVVVDTVTASLDYLVLGEKRAKGRSEARTKAQRLRKKGDRPRILTEAEFRESVRVDVSSKRFAFAGGFDCAPTGFDTLLHRMVEAAGASVSEEVDASIDYIVIGERRGKGKAARVKAAEKLKAEGHGVQRFDEKQFLELIRTEVTHATGDRKRDFAAFVGNLFGTVNHNKMVRALKMLKDESFQLYSQLEDDSLVGVVRSQTGAGTVYAPWLTAEGSYGCGTPDMEDCMGLQGSPCKHLLVLLIGLARSGEFDIGRAAAWISLAASKGPSESDERAADAFIRYKGAEAGEIDWRPTETVPEDFYAI